MSEAGHEDTYVLDCPACGTKNDVSARGLAFILSHDDGCVACYRCAERIDPRDDDVTVENHGRDPLGRW